MRWIVFLACALAVIGGTSSLFAQPEPTWICCNDLDDCSSHEKCCSEVIMGLEPCDDVEKPGYCVLLCIRPTK